MLSEAEAVRWARYIEAFGPLDYSERIFRRLDSGFALLAMLMINRTGGRVPAPGAKGQPVQMAEFMWEPPQARPLSQKEGTLENLWTELGGGPLREKAKRGKP